jgi:hypothetical protein
MITVPVFVVRNVWSARTWKQGNGVSVRRWQMPEAMNRPGGKSTELLVIEGGVLPRWEHDSVSDGEWRRNITIGLRRKRKRSKQVKMALITSAVIRLSVPREGLEDGDGRCLAGVDCEEIDTVEPVSPRRGYQLPQSVSTTLTPRSVVMCPMRDTIPLSDS